MKIVVIIPTYNEAGSISDVLDGLIRAVQNAPEHEWMLLVVDGNSTDATRRLVQEKAKVASCVRLLEEDEKRGIASAYTSGMRHALDVLGAEAFAEFDGDGQHDPRDIVRMAHAIEDADHVVGSRYINGGSVPREWALYRKLISRFGSLYARLLLELPVHDVTSGLKLTRASVAHVLPLWGNGLLTNDYAYKIQFLTLLAESGARISEVPITFRPRANDVSKSTVRDLYESLRVTAILRLKRLRQWRLLRVIGIGGIGFLIQTLVFELLGIQSSLLTASTAAVVGGECAILSNFLLNERFAFRDRRGSSSSLPKRLFRFHLVSSSSVLLQWLLLFGVERVTSDALLLRLTFVAGVALGFLLNYTGYYFFVWKGGRNV